MNKQSKPPRKDHPYYGKRYSVPVLCWDKEGVLNVNLVCWDYSSDGWVFANLRDGPDSWNYEIECEVWALPPDMPDNSLTVSPDAKREANTSGGIGSS